MARRDNQGIQIAMIVFILTTLVFLVTTYFGWSSSSQLAAENASLQENLTTAENGIRSSEQLVSTLKKYVGVGQELDANTVEAELQKAVEQTYGQGLPPENQNFIDIANRLTTRVQELSANLVQSRENERKLQADIATVRKEQTAIAAAAQAQRDETVADLRSVKAAYDERTNQLTAQNDKLVGEKRNALEAASSATSEADSKVATYETTISQKTSIIEKLSTELSDVTKDSPDQYDGNVIAVLSPQNEVLLNIGRRHAVRPKTTFTVFDADENNVRSAEKKARIEVIRVRDDDTCLARVIEPNFLKPIVPGDHIFSPIWSPGQRLGVALVGKMDIDGDGSDDRDYVRNLIELNGGRIDAEDVDGKVRGEMTVNTRYIVKGESEAEDAAKNNMVGEAAKLSIEPASVDEFLDLMGFKGRARAISFTGTGSPDDFAPKPRGGIVRPSTGSTTFRERSPVLRRRDLPPARSAY